MLEETRMGVLVSIDLGSSEYLDSATRFSFMWFPSIWEMELFHPA